MYTRFSKKLKEKYGCKVYKIPLSVDATCPVRDGTLSSDGCAFCGKKGAGYENADCTRSISDQIRDNLDIFTRKYKAEKFILYFQNFTNTYLDFAAFKKNIIEAVSYPIESVAVSISTRPDCIDEDYLCFLDAVRDEYRKDIVIELGLQSVNNDTLRKLERGHTLADFINAVMMIKRHGFEIGVHVIASIPYDSREDLIEAAKLLSILEVDTVKVHSLYVEKGTILADRYERGELQMISLEEFVERVVLFLEYLNEDIAVERLVSRVPEDEDLLFLNWDRSHWVINDMITDKMKSLGTCQGKKYREYQKGLLGKFK